MGAKAIFVGGTASHAGKSWMATALCRHLARRGLRVAPFKAQNMSNNSYPCREGGEIGRAQVAQAEACGLEPSSDMNPILLKPNADGACQVVVNGRVWRDLRASEYYEQFDFLLEQVLAAYRRLAGVFEYIVIEGAGSVTEMNLRRTDLVNLGLAARVGARALLVADIDRGGVFAALAGTFCLLPPEEASLVRAFAVNRFRGDRALFDGGVTYLENLTQRKCLGVFPYAEEIRIDEEDGVSMEDAVSSPEARVAILRLPRISNLTDFRLIENAAWISRPVARRFECVILPGTKNTIGDLAWLRRQGLDRWIVAQKETGARIIGICGGYQMLGEQIWDAAEIVEGLGLLPVSTVLKPEKTTRVVDAVTVSGIPFRAYEIHMGQTRRPGDATPFAIVEGKPEGVALNGCVGTYLHGALENEAVLAELIGAPVVARPSKRAMYDRLADWFEVNADLRAFEELYL